MTPEYLTQARLPEICGSYVMLYIATFKVLQNSLCSYHRDIVLVY